MAQILLRFASDTIQKRLIYKEYLCSNRRERNSILGNLRRRREDQDDFELSTFFNKISVWYK